MSLKRKLSVSDERPEVVITSKPPKKKTKTSSTAEVVQVATKKQSAPKKPKAAVIRPTLRDEQFPDGYFYCHQCNKKRDLEKGEYRDAID